MPNENKAITQRGQHRTSSRQIPGKPASRIYFVRQQRLPDSAWLIGWYGSRLPAARRVWLLIALAASSGQCMLLRAHPSRDSRCIIGDLEEAALGKVHMLCISHADQSSRHHLLERWARIKGIYLQYSPSFLPFRGSGLEAYGHQVEQEVLKKVRPRSLAHLNSMLSAFRKQSVHEEQGARGQQFYPEPLIG